MGTTLLGAALRNPPGTCSLGNPPGTCSLRNPPGTCSLRNLPGTCSHCLCSTYHCRSNCLSVLDMHTLVCVWMGAILCDSWLKFAFSCHVTLYQVLQSSFVHMFFSHFYSVSIRTDSVPKDISQNCFADVHTLPVSLCVCIGQHCCAVV